MSGKGKIGIIIALIIIAVAVFMLSGSNQSKTASGAKDELIIGQNTDISTLDICEGMGSSTATACLNIFDTLTRSGSDGKIEPWLAESFEAKNNNTWQFKLRKGVEFTNGEPFNAEAVKYSFERQVDPKHSFSLAGDYANIERVEIVDEYTVNFKTKEPFPMLPIWLTYLGMIPPKYAEEVGPEEFGKKPVGTGPYVFSEWVKDSHLTLTANEKYFKGKPPFAKLTFKIIPEESTRIAALQNGEIDLAVLVPPSQIDQINKSDGVSIVSGPTTRPIYLGMNLLHEGPLADVRIRKAICYALDVPSIIHNVLLDNGKQIAAFSLPVWAGFDSTIEPYKQDKEKTKELLAQAGYTNGKGLSFKLDVVDGEYPAIKEVAQAIAGQLSEAGIETSVVTMDKNTFRSKLKDKSIDSLYITGFGGMTSCNPNIAALVLSAGQRYCCYNDQVMTDLINKGSTEMDDAQFNKIWRDIQHKIIDDAPIASLYQLYGIYGISDKIKWTPRFDEAILAFDIKPTK